MKEVTKPVVAAFDFDGTITYSDSLIFFLLSTTGFLKGIPKLMMEIPTVVAWALGRSTRQEAKERLITRFLKGCPLEIVQGLGRAYAVGSLNKIVRPEAIERIKWHKNQGHRCVLVSASLDIYLKPWSQQLGIDDTITSSLEVDKNGRVTGNLLGKNCWGQEKIVRLEETVGPRNNYLLYAYGDTVGDKPLMEIADFSYYKVMPKSNNLV